MDSEQRSLNRQHLIRYIYEQAKAEHRKIGFQPKIARLTEQSLLLLVPKDKNFRNFVNANKMNENSPPVDDLPERIASHYGGELTKEVIRVVLSMRIAPNANEEIVGHDSVKKLLRDKIINPMKRPDLHTGLHQPPKGILLFGPPGTGKSLLARWIGREINSDNGASFFEVTPSALISKYYGETETLIRALFLTATFTAPSVIFIDEADSLLGKRRAADDETNIRMKNQFLQMLDGASTNEKNKTVIVVAATNRPHMLDEAALRRLSKRVRVPLPDEDTRLHLLKLLLSKDSQEEGDWLRTLVSQLSGWSFSDIKGLCSKAAEYPYDEAIEAFGGLESIPDASAFRALEYKDFLKAIEQVRPATTLSSEEELKLWEQRHGSR